MLCVHPWLLARSCFVFTYIIRVIMIMYIKQLALTQKAAITHTGIILSVQMAEMPFNRGSFRTIIIYCTMAFYSALKPYYS